TCIDSIFLIGIYVGYLVWISRFPAHEVEDADDLPWISRRIITLNPARKYLATALLFILGGIALYYSAHPFLETLKKWSLAIGVSTFVFVQWVAPFVSEFPEKLSAFNWARQRGKAPLALMNMVSSNINQWTMLAAMIPMVYNLSLGWFQPIVFDQLHKTELALTIAQSALGGILLLDLRFSILDAASIFVLWLVQFVKADLREEIAIIYGMWIIFEIVKLNYLFLSKGHLPRAIEVFRQRLRQKA
ncbi:MAG: hypothetical protein HY537_12420, partial [Deltaproteobacteria bacterium]|nr:hypothetical protein [Deltaproteobacteria bacterium]